METIAFPPPTIYQDTYVHVEDKIPVVVLFILTVVGTYLGIYTGKWYASKDLASKPIHGHGIHM